VFCANGVRRALEQIDPRYTIRADNAALIAHLNKFV